ncbi:MAG TPA: CHAD domain-containing protein [Vicinamibacterales bacterium]|nr:CHAD domain-containing protein [Vicinamibacterales bacterium]
MNTSTCRDRLWRKRLNELSAVWPDFVNGDSDGLHKTRVASRRIREALPIVGASAAPAKVKKLAKKMRALTRSLGPIRELEVELDILDDKSKTVGAPGRAIEMVRREVASRRQALRDELADNAPVGDLKKLLKKLEKVSTSGQKAEGRRKKGRGQRAESKAASKIETHWRGVLATRLMRRAKALAVALDEAGPVYVPERLHTVRIATKKLRYALEIARDAKIAAATPVVRTLKRHQERLGRLHDLQVLLKHVRETEASPGVGSRVNDLTAYADSLDRECRKLHADFVEHRADLVAVVKDVRHQVVPALTTPPRRQAHVAATKRPAVRPRRAK